MREIIRAGAWTGFRELVLELGGDPDAILAAVHLSAGQLAEADRYLPLRSFLDCQEIAAARLKRPDFGLRFGNQDTPASLGAIGILVMNSRTAREAIEACARFIHIQNPAQRMALAPAPTPGQEILTFTVNMRRSQPAIQNAERIAASAFRVIGTLVGPKHGVREIWLPHKPLSPISTYRRVFGQTPHFGKPMLGFIMDRAALDELRASRSEQMRLLAEAYLRRFDTPRRTVFADRVISMTRGILQSGDCSSLQVADALGIHERTLQRRLKDEGATFEAIKDGIRREQAEVLLAQPHVSLSLIAFMLGYSDSSTFTRSCRRWFGEAPSKMRRRLAQGSGMPDTRRAS